MQRWPHRRLSTVRSSTVSAAPAHRPAASSNGSGLAAVRESTPRYSPEAARITISPTTWALHVDGTTADGAAPYDLELGELKDWRTIPQLATVSARAVVVAYTAPVGERREVRLARVALPEADH